MELRAAHLPVLRQRRPRADHVVRHARRAVPRLRVRRLQAVSEGVRRPPRAAAGDGGGGHDRDAAAGRGGDAEGLYGLKRRVSRRDWPRKRENTKGHQPYWVSCFRAFVAKRVSCCARSGASRQVSPRTTWTLSPWPS